MFRFFKLSLRANLRPPASSSWHLVYLSVFQNNIQVAHITAAAAGYLFHFHTLPPNICYDVSVKRYFDASDTRIVPCLRTLTILKHLESAHFFYEKWLLPGVLRIGESCFFMQAWNAWLFYACITNIELLHYTTNNAKIQFSNYCQNIKSA